MTLPHSDACCRCGLPGGGDGGLAGRAQQSLCFFRRRSPSILYETHSVWCRASCQMARGNERGRSAGCSPITSSSRYGRPGKGNDKGNVEGVVGYAPELHDAASRFASWDAFNGHLEERRNRQGNVLRGHRESIGERFVRDREALKRHCRHEVLARATSRARGSTRCPWCATGRMTIPCPSPTAIRKSGSVAMSTGGYRLRRRDHCPTPPFLRPGRYGLRSDPLPGFAGAQDRCPGSGRAASRWELPDAFPTLRRLLEARMGKAGKREYVQVLRLVETFDLEVLHGAVKDVAPGCDRLRRRQTPCAVPSRATPAQTRPGYPLPASGQRGDHGRRQLGLLGGGAS